jgi:hypothetical protein
VSKRVAKAVKKAREMEDSTAAAHQCTGSGSKLLRAIMMEFTLTDPQF